MKIYSKEFKEGEKNYKLKKNKLTKKQLKKLPERSTKTPYWAELIREIACYLNGEHAFNNVFFIFSNF